VPIPRSRAARLAFAVAATFSWLDRPHAQVSPDRDVEIDVDLGASCRAAHRTPGDPTCPRWARRQGDELVLFRPLRFAIGKAHLRPESMVVLDDVVAWLGRHRDVHLEIQGHYRDTEYAATPLSHHRARSVMRYLIDRGVAADRLTANGYGESRPRYPPPRSPQLARRARDRRAAFTARLAAGHNYAVDSGRSDP
jgi:outer membrane protein OmpA-like peptidoglycan-associated protein